MHQAWLTVTNSYLFIYECSKKDKNTGTEKKTQTSNQGEMGCHSASIFEKKYKKNNEFQHTLCGSNIITTESESCSNIIPGKYTAL